eukprot:Gregarina_sp_Poly_1__11092@NODE_894_length_5819_cov_27_147253_g638_i0_p7_GENE_NODE_894_length_5819_cov_27_147253_g638_i0NODE_894_length_5819_cov_27_147253_g638_i0_p7_ORF_typecomplete_len161_score9_87_NODE_894_length_5819_cov_27_147253_g638_i022862768
MAPLPMVPDALLFYALLIPPAVPVHVVLQLDREYNFQQPTSYLALWVMLTGWACQSEPLDRLLPSASTKRCIFCREFLFCEGAQLYPPTCQTDSNAVGELKIVELSHIEIPDAPWLSSIADAQQYKRQDSRHEVGVIPGLSDRNFFLSISQKNDADLGIL